MAARRRMDLMHPELVDSRALWSWAWRWEEDGRQKKSIIFDPTHPCKGTLRKPPRATAGGASVAPWGSVLSCSAARAVGISLLELPVSEKKRESDLSHPLLKFRQVIIFIDVRNGMSYLIICWFWSFSQKIITPIDHQPTFRPKTLRLEFFHVLSFV